jgi:transmembrane sensor
MTLSSKQIQQQATQWATKARLRGLSTEEDTQLRQWLDSDIRNKGAYLRAQALQVSVERVAALAGGVTPAAVEHGNTWLRLLWRPIPVTGAALLLVAAVVLGIGFKSGDRYNSGVGELRRVALEDGSSMLLNTETRAVVRLSNATRDVTLAEGEALFNVAHDPHRPFIVHAGSVTVKAIGTAFSVRSDAQRVDVTVTEGVVEVISDEGAPALHLSANEHATVARARVAQIEAVAPHEMERRLAWQTGQLEFDGQSLGDAVAEINRHNRRQILVTDPQLAKHPIVGSFRAIDSEAFAQIAAAALNARVVEEGDTIRIEPRQ